MVVRAIFGQIMAVTTALSSRSGLDVGPVAMQ